MCLSEVNHTLQYETCIICCAEDVKMNYILNSTHPAEDQVVMDGILVFVWFK